MAPEPHKAERAAPECPTLDLWTAQRIADRLCELLSPAIERIEPAGALRRLERFVSAIDLVVISRPLPDLVGEPAGSALDSRLAELLEAGRLHRGPRAGERYREFILGAMPNLPVRLSITSPDRWGLIITLRTGPASFNRRLCTPRSAGGLLPDGYRIHHGQLWHHGEAVPLYRERNLFRLLGGWIPPQRRFAVGAGR